MELKLAYRELWSTKPVPNTRQRGCALCGDSYNHIDAYVTHLREKHAIPTTKASLICFEIGECPFCRKFFTTLGWTRHVGTCKVDRTTDPTIKWPRKCWVYW